MPKTSVLFKVLIPSLAVAFILTVGYEAANAPRLAGQVPRGPAQKANRPYQVVHGWPVLPEGIVFGHVTGVGVDSHNHVFVFHRADHSIFNKTFDQLISSPAIMCFEGSTGKLVASWGANRFLDPHGLRVDQDDHIWVTDIQLHQVFKFSHDGQLLMALGEARKPGLDGKHFNQPTDVAVAPDGSFYVSDGHGDGNDRVAKFSSKGEFLFDWGHKGDQPGEFDIPHSITMDREGRVYVADRTNSRIQVFKGDGTFLYQWKTPQLKRPYISKTPQAITFGPDGYLYVVDGDAAEVTGRNGLLVTAYREPLLRLETSGNIAEMWGSYGYYDGQLDGAHDIAVGRDGAVYVGDIFGRRVQKFVRP
jgi:peptidylamidoglycolate lyase